MEEKYNVSVIAVDCLNMEIADLEKIFERILFEFPVKEININLPGWTEGLPKNHWIRTDILNSLKESIKVLQKLSEVSSSLSKLKELDVIKKLILQK